MNAAVADHEQLHMIVVQREPWSIENGFLTPTMKVRRGPHREGDGAARRALVPDRTPRPLALSRRMDRLPLPARHGGDRVADVLHANGVRFVFTLCGGHISPILARRAGRAASASSTCATKPRPCSPPTRWRG